MNPNAIATPDTTTPLMTTAELAAWIDQTIADLEADIEAAKERLAIMADAPDDGQTTTERAIEALQRPERFRGEHDCARTWLRDQKSHAGIFRKQTICTINTSIPFPVSGSPLSPIA